MLFVSGNICPSSGTYMVVSHPAHPRKIKVLKGRKFPACRDCQAVVNFVLVEITVAPGRKVGG